MGGSAIKVKLQKRENISLQFSIACQRDQINQNKLVRLKLPDLRTNGIREIKC